MLEVLHASLALEGEDYLEDSMSCVDHRGLPFTPGLHLTDNV